MRLCSMSRLKAQQGRGTLSVIRYLLRQVFDICLVIILYTFVFWHQQKCMLFSTYFTVKTTIASKTYISVSL